MKNCDERADLTNNLMGQVQNLQSLLDQISLLEGRIKGMAVKLSKFNDDLIEPRTETYSSINIIPFPGKILPRANLVPALTPHLAKPGSTLPPAIPDFRPVLQRDGLILLAWDKRVSERGELYSAYWVTSVGIPRYYASKPHPERDFSFARPHHKSYAAEDGIEYFGQKAPIYIVHVAPELMMSNPNHSELRLAHINTLKRQGSNVDFDYKYLLKTEKNRNLPRQKSGSYSHKQTGA